MWQEASVVVFTPHSRENTSQAQNKGGRVEEVLLCVWRAEGVVGVREQGVCTGKEQFGDGDSQRCSDDRH